MTIKASGSPLKFSDIAAEFGTPPGKNLGAYRISQTVGSLTNLALDNASNSSGIVTALIPRSGAIKFSDFYSKSLNVVVDFYSVGDYTTRINALNRYNSGSLTIIGGFTSSAPVSGANTKVIVNVNKIIGSAKGNRNYVALKTGANWGTGAQIELIVGSSGTLIGAGGDGGQGANGNGTNGTDGSSAIGVQYPTRINNQGVIRAGRGGGGGGGGAYGTTYGQTQKGRCSQARNSGQVAGGGGAGGLGYPYGTGGQAQTSGNRITTNPQAGGTGNLSQNGGAGAGGVTCGGGGCDQSGTGGSGGGANSSGNGGVTKSNGSGGLGGNQGYAIIIDSTGSLISYVGNGVDGSNTNGTVL